MASIVIIADECSLRLPVTAFLTVAGHLAAAAASGNGAPHRYSRNL